MSESDGIKISNKATWEHSVKELVVILFKRCIALPSKMIGFKPLVFFIATWLLIKGFIESWIWFSVVVMVLFGIVGLKIISKYEEKEK